MGAFKVKWRQVLASLEAQPLAMAPALPLTACTKGTRDTDGTATDTTATTITLIIMSTTTTTTTTGITTTPTIIRRTNASMVSLRIPTVNGASANATLDT